MTPNRIFGLDILRAFAILAVFIGHGINHYAPQFYQSLVHVIAFPDGVALFFCLSGYLITQSLLNNISGSSGGSLLQFWCKRAIRTIPPYIIALSLYNIIVTIFKGDALSVASVQSFFFVQNIAWPISGGYPESWSLSVEEWFYALLLLLPAASLYLKPRPRLAYQDLASAAIALVVAAIAYRVLWAAGAFGRSDETWDWMWSNYVEKTVFGRLDAPGLGVLASLLSHRNPKLWNSARFARNCLFWGIGLTILTHQKLLLEFYPSWLTSRNSEIHDQFLIIGSRAGITLLLRPSLVSLGWVLLLPFCSRLASIRASFAHRFISRVAASAFSIYLWHYSIAMFVIAPAIGTISRFPPTLDWIFFIIIGVGGAQLFYVLVERPSIRMKEVIDEVFSKRASIARQHASAIDASVSISSRVTSSDPAYVANLLDRRSWSKLSPLLLMLLLPLVYLIANTIQVNMRKAYETFVADKYAAADIIIGGVCNFDGSHIVIDEVALFGWAVISTDSAVAAEAILLQVDASGSNRRIIAQRSKRPDVAEYFKNEALEMAGFTAVLKRKAGTKVTIYQAFEGHLYQCRADYVMP